MRAGGARDLHWLSKLLLRCGLYHVRSHAIDQWKSLVSAPLQWGKDVYSSHRRCYKSHGNRNREWTTAHNNRIYNVPKDSSLASQVVLREDFPKFFTSPFAISTSLHKRECGEDIPSSYSATLGLWKEEDIMSEKAQSFQTLRDWGKGGKAALISSACRVY